MLAVLTGLLSLIVAAYKTGLPPSWAQPDSKSTVHRTRRPPHGHLRKRHGMYDGHELRTPNTIVHGVCPVRRFEEQRAPTHLLFNISTTATLDLSPFLPEALHNGSTIPVLLDVLSDCSWLAATDMVCIDPAAPELANTSSTSDAPDNDTTPLDNCLRGPGYTSDYVAAILRDVNATDGSGQEQKCTHYLSGDVTGSVKSVALQLDSALQISPVSIDSNAGDELEKEMSALAVDMILARTFSAPSPLGFIDFQHYYGAGSGVLGLGTDQLQAGNRSAPVSFRGSKSHVQSSNRDFLGDILSTPAWQADNSSRAIVGLALPRDGDVGSFTVGASVRNTTNANDIADGGVISMLPAGSGPAFRAVNSWTLKDDLRHLQWSFPSVSVSVAANETQPVALRRSLDSARRLKVASELDGDELKHHRRDLQGGERYFIDTALPVIWTTDAVAAFVANLFDPPGWIDGPTASAMQQPGTYRIPCDATPPSSVAIMLTDGKRYVSVPMYPSDLIVPMRLRNTDNGEFTNSCMSAFQSGDWQLSVSDGTGPVRRHNGTDGDVTLRRLGWPFLRNVLLDFDFEKAEVGVSVRKWPNGEDGASNKTGVSTTTLDGPTTFTTSTTPTSSGTSSSNLNVTDSTGSSSLSASSAATVSAPGGSRVTTSTDASSMSPLSSVGITSTTTSATATIMPIPPISFPSTDFTHTTVTDTSASVSSQSSTAVSSTSFVSPSPPPSTASSATPSDPSTTSPTTPTPTSAPTEQPLLPPSFPPTSDVHTIPASTFDSASSTTPPTLEPPHPPLSFPPASYTHTTTLTTTYHDPFFTPQSQPQSQAGPIVVPVEPSSGGPVVVPLPPSFSGAATGDLSPPAGMERTAEAGGG
ncbi:uncharacterized protein AB675_2977 [Cyphellophora attinorum]|uniref:Peptidase A1 domain-containing protein n=1 Tax=Cyphellophora attinorum TaxID=1664694 RepID=A0A0N0NJC2_9EURO|nr:uncharacterized protein AB675_2977 [Phialophora attinorum]KPI36449.1 hypothetical protein AB675_2977 [Phialophora attinorum]